MNLVGEKFVFPLNQLASPLCLFPGDFAKGFRHGTGSLWPPAVVVAAAWGHPAPCGHGAGPSCVPIPLPVTRMDNRSEPQPWGSSRVSHSSAAGTVPHG